MFHARNGMSAVASPLYVQETYVSQRTRGQVRVSYVIFCSVTILSVRLICVAPLLVPVITEALKMI